MSSPCLLGAKCAPSAVPKGPLSHVSSIWGAVGEEKVMLGGQTLLSMQKHSARAKPLFFFLNKNCDYAEQKNHSFFILPPSQVLYEDCRMVVVHAPYVAGFLAFREAPFLVEALHRLEEHQPGLRPQV